MIFFFAAVNPSKPIMNLISIEEHLFFTFNKTKDDKYLKLLDEVRLMRTELLKQIITDYEGEVWCISKHLLAASMRLMGIGERRGLDQVPLVIGNAILFSLGLIISHLLTGRKHGKIQSQQ